jgi:hypothetical protein
MIMVEKKIKRKSFILVEELEVCSLLLYIVEITAVNREMFWKFFVYFSLKIGLIELEVHFL